MDKLSFDLIVSKHVTSFTSDVLEGTLKKTHGEPTMSDEDVKLAIVLFAGYIKDQDRIIKSLAAEIHKLKEEKKSRKFWKR